MTKYKNEILVGLFVVVSFFIFAYLIITVGKIQVGQTTDIKAIFESASGIVKDSAVMTAGVKIGYVKNVELQDSKALVNIVLDKSVKLSKDSKAVIRAKSLLGEKYLEVVQGKSKLYLESGDVIKDTVVPMEIDQLVIKLTPLLEEFDSKELTKVLTSLSKIIQENDGNISNIIKNIDTITTIIVKNKNSIDRIVSNSEYISVETRKILSENKPIISRVLNNIDKLTKDADTDGKTVLKNVKSVTNDLSKITSEFAKYSPELSKRLDIISRDLSKITQEVNKTTPEFTKNLNSLVANLNDTIIEIKKESPQLAKDLANITKDFAIISQQLSKANTVDETKEVLMRLNETLKQIQPIMARLEKFDDKKLNEEIQRIMTEVGIKVNLF